MPSDVTVIPVPSGKVSDVQVRPFNDVLATTAGRLAILGGIPAPLVVNSRPALPVATAIELSVHSYEIRLPAVPVATFTFGMTLIEMVCHPAYVLVPSPDSVWFYQTASDLA